ncbi:hypothetical protein A9G42_00620 [Gilliamella sp. Nev6-6]|uniref:hypothetical protein n=1 Tax=Gilliamella sp. Nev6-6 TaxID=3120252 RepID=UPI00080E000B|nr:hypothetical protein [Gilliamella apicola]OCG19424.1 hypothetical protein A9G47_04045 [Gilliamella apicola]OCG58102.1 hypothetical protein A9G40_11050 [Gilliamella apicola]OCG64065.1 hypothetical protein A9G30_07710 [Gilliamella apicola]OCG67598.1 hypothetical protein A9G41_09815 [Gilliamella apicola]OCG78643.1 hypothetical protein A9G42_00620 [Gilliamella apicola]
MWPKNLAHKLVKYQYIKQHLLPYPLLLVCRHLEVSVSDYYTWLKPEPKSTGLFENIKALYC